MAKKYKLYDLGIFGWWLLCIIKAVWEALVNMVWGFAGFFLLSALVLYFKQDISLIAPLMKMVVLFMENYKLLFMILFLWYVYINLTTERKRNETE